MPKAGYLTPSAFGSLMTSNRKGDEPGLKAQAVIDQLVMDMLGVPRMEDLYVPAACQWGLDYEWAAIEAYKERRLCDVETPEWTVAPDLPYVGGHADGRVCARGGLEVKCPYNQAHHLANIESDEQLKQYRWQIYGYQWVYGWDWIDFCSYDPRFPEPLDLHVVRVERDEAMIGCLRQACARAYEIATDRAARIKAGRTA